MAPIDSFRRRTITVLDQTRHDLRAAGLLDDPTPESLAKTKRRITRSAQFKRATAVTDLDYVFDDFGACVAGAKASRGRDAALHGREFSSELVKYVDKILGKEAGAILRRNYRNANLKFSRPKVLSPAAKEKAAERMRGMHADRIRAELIQEIRDGEL